MARISRKDLKTDKFAVEVGHTVEFVAAHRSQVVLYGAIALVVVLLGAGLYYYRQRQEAARHVELAKGLRVMSAPVGQDAGPGQFSFPTEEARNREAAKVFNEMVARHSGSDSAVLARYHLAGIAADAGKIADAEKEFKAVAESGNRKYASLAKLALSDIYFSAGKTAEAEKFLRDLIAEPTTFVSKEQATIALARGIGKAKPDEARKLLEPLRTESSAVSRTSVTALGELANQ
ncbi:MAG: tetratricopeptide repeat protein [Bryobacteraceae bacterium]